MINIYIATSLKGLKIQNGIVCLILENAENKGNTATQFGKILDMTKYTSEIIALKNALKMVGKKEEITIFTDCRYVAAAFERGWILNWQKNNWKTARNKDVKHREEFEKILELLNGRKIKFQVQKQHEYKQWMQKEVNDRAERLKERSK